MIPNTISFSYINPNNFQIYFCSRTHSQLTQFIGEVKRTPFKESIRTVPLASRQSLCVNPDVKKLKNLSLINERYFLYIWMLIDCNWEILKKLKLYRCLELQKNKQSKVTQTGTSKEVIKKRKCSGGCPFNNKININKLSDEMAARIQDIEELVSRGQEISACPYYAARASVKRSQVRWILYLTVIFIKKEVEKSVHFCMDSSWWLFHTIFFYTNPREKLPK